MAKTFFPGSRRLSAGFSLFGTLCVICVLSAAGAGLCAAVSMRYRLTKKTAAQFYRTLEAQNERVQAELVQSADAKSGEAYAVD